jgi:peptide deformylase
MSVRPILVYGDPALEAKNLPVEDFDEKLEMLVADLFETGWKAPGLGLAAPQIGVNFRLATIDLSVLDRPSALVVRAQNERGDWREIEAEGLLAQAVCHEVDHLDGTLLVHHLRGMKKRLFMRRVEKMRRLGVWQATA